MKKHLMAVIVFGLLGGLILAGKTWSQAPARVAQPADTDGQYAPNPYYGYSTPAFGSPPFRVESGVTQPPSEIGQLMNQLREADDDAKKAELTKQLETAVAKHFDEDLKNRETELTKLEERLTKLRAQLDRRRKAKAEIIQLQIKVMVNEAEGLGFSGASVFDTGVPGGMAPLGSRPGVRNTIRGLNYGQPPGAAVSPAPTRPQPKR